MIITLCCSAATSRKSHYDCAALAAAVAAAAAAAAAGDPKELTYSELTDFLLHTNSTTAAAEVTSMMERLNFTSTYAFSKLLTEQLIDDPTTLPGVSKVIVRPSLIASMAGRPYPG
jgi:thioester reductase-like protein